MYGAEDTGERVNSPGELEGQCDLTCGFCQQNQKPSEWSGIKQLVSLDFIGDPNPNAGEKLASCSPTVWRIDVAAH